MFDFLLAKLFVFFLITLKVILKSTPSGRERFLKKSRILRNLIRRNQNKTEQIARIFASTFSKEEIYGKVPCFIPSKLLKSR